MRDLFGSNFVFCSAYQPVFPAYAGVFGLFFLFQKIGLGKLLSVNDLLRLFELKFLRVVRVNGGSDRAAQTVPRPDADDFAGNTAFLATADEGIPQLVRVVVGQQPLHARGNCVEVGVLRFFTVDIGKRLLDLRRKRNFPEYHILSKPLLARLTLQPSAVDDLNAFQL